MFRGHRRQVRLLFSALDVILLALAFQFSYWTRARLELKNVFFIEPHNSALLLGWSMLMWVALGYWWEIYDRIDAAHTRVILRDAFRQCLLGSASVVLFEYLIRLDLSRFFLALFGDLPGSCFAWCGSTQAGSWARCAAAGEFRTSSSSLERESRRGTWDGS